MKLNFANFNLKSFYGDRTRIRSLLRRLKTIGHSLRKNVSIWEENKHSSRCHFDISKCFTFRKDEGSCFTSSLMNISQSPYEEHRVKTICDREELYFNEDNIGVIAAGE